MNMKKVGILGLLAMAVGAVFTPAVASAQEPWGYHRRYVPAPMTYHDRYWREREWRARHRCEHDRYWGYR